MISGLVLKAQIKTAAENIYSSFFFVFFRENKAWYFLWIVNLADKSHEMPSLVSPEK